MNQPLLNDNLQNVQHSLTRMSQAYQHGLAIVSQIEALSDPVAELPLLQRLVDLIHDVQDASQALQQVNWGESSLSAEVSRDLKLQRENATQLAQTLVTRVDAALSSRRTRLVQLTPQIDQELNRRKMLSAYGPSAESSAWQVPATRSSAP